MRMLDDPPIVELVVDHDQDEGEHDPEHAHGHHGDVQGERHRLDVLLDDRPVLRHLATSPSHQLSS